MKVTQEMIEDKVVKYVHDKGEDPKYVLLDKESYEGLNKFMEPKEKGQQVGEDYQLSKFFTSKAELNILSVNTDEDFFEIVG